MNRRQCYKTFFSSSFQTMKNKLECLALESFAMVTFLLVNVRQGWKGLQRTNTYLTNRSMTTKVYNTGTCNQSYKTYFVTDQGAK
jgi:hypothetical protein